MRIIIGTILFVFSLIMYRFSFGISFQLLGSLGPFFIFLIPLLNLLLTIASVLFCLNYGKRFMYVGLIAGLVPAALFLLFVIHGLDPVQELVFVGSKIFPINPETALASKRPREFNNISSVFTTLKGRIMGLTGNLAGKIAAYTEAIEKDPKSAVAYANRSYAYTEKRDWEKALVDCQKAIELDPYYANSYRIRGLVRRAFGDVDGAMRDFYKATRLKVNYFKANLDLANAQQEFKKKGKDVMIRTDAPLEPMTREQAIADAKYMLQGMSTDGMVQTVAENEAKYVDAGQLRTHRFWSVRWEPAGGVAKKPVEFILDKDSHEKLASFGKVYKL